MQTRIHVRIQYKNNKKIMAAELEPVPVEPKLFSGTGVGTGAVISYFGSGSTAPELKLSL